VNSDSFFEIGHTHKVCEDYAVSGTVEGRCYGIISDGCSSSEDTDIGSRLLVKALQQTIHNAYNKESCRQALVSSVHVAQAAAKVIGVPVGALDATLGFIIEDECAKHVVHLALQGDGIIAHKTEQGVWVEVIDYDQNAPGYLSYWLDNSRFAKYDNNCRGYRVWGGWAPAEKPDLLDEDPYPCGRMKPYCTSFDMRETEWVAIFTDGLESFKENFASAPFANPTEMLEYFTAFKNTKGEFVKRRCQKAMKEIGVSQYEPVVHSDDFAMACIHA